MFENLKKKFNEGKQGYEYTQMFLTRMEMGDDYVEDSPLPERSEPDHKEELDDYADMLLTRLGMEEDYVENVEELDNASEDRQINKKKKDAKGFFSFLRRWRRLEGDMEEKENEEKVTRMSDVFKEGFKGAIAGLSIGQVVDSILPREELDAMTDLREDYIRMYGDEDIYKEVKSNMYDQIRKLNKALGVSAFGGEDISEGLRQALIANVPEDMANAFALSAAKLKKVGVDLGDSTAKAFSMGFKKNSVEVMDSLANVLASAKINEEVKTSITESIAEVGKDLSAMGLTPEQQKKSASNLAATLAQLESSNIMTVDQATQVRELILKATRGDTEAYRNLGTMGVSVGSVVKSAKTGDWGSAYEQVLRGIANSPLHAEVLKAMDLNIDEDQIVRLKSAKTEINVLTERTNELVEKSKVKIDGLSQAELRAKEISKASWSERFKNWAGTTKLIESASDVLERLNIDASTATSILGGLAGAGKGLFDTFLLVKISGLKVPGMIMKLIPSLSGLGATLAGVGAAALPILGIVAAIGAVIAAGYLMYKHWDKITAWFGKATEWLKKKVDSFKNTVVDFAKKIPGVKTLMSWFGSDDDKKKAEKVVESVEEDTKVEDLKPDGEVKADTGTKSELTTDMDVASATPDLPVDIEPPKSDDGKVEIKSPALESAEKQKVEVIEPVVTTKSKDNVSNDINNALANAGLKTGNEKTNALLDLLVRIAANIDKKTPTNLDTGLVLK